MRKYAILEIIRSLPYEEYKEISKKLPGQLNVSNRTFRRWLYLRKNDKGEIPLSKLKEIANILKADINQLIN